MSFICLSWFSVALSPAMSSLPAPTACWPFLSPCGKPTTDWALLFEIPFEHTTAFPIFGSHVGRGSDLRRYQNVSASYRLVESYNTKNLHQLIMIRQIIVQSKVTMCAKLFTTTLEEEKQNSFHRLHRLYLEIDNCLPTTTKHERDMEGRGWVTKRRSERGLMPILE